MEGSECRRLMPGGGFFHVLPAKNRVFEQPTDGGEIIF
jgi:hypothetical protein